MEHRGLTANLIQYIESYSIVLHESGMFRDQKQKYLSNIDDWIRDQNV